MAIEALITVATTALTGLVTGIVEKYGERAVDKLAEAPKTFVDTQKLEQASKEYVTRYAERYGLLKVLGMREPVWLDDVYVAARFLDNQSIRSFESIEAMEEVYRQTNQRSLGHHQAETLPGLQIANEKQYLMLLGGPGTGKSTFLRKMGLEALKGQQPAGYQHLCIPVLIELKQFRFYSLDIEAAISQEFEICGFPESAQFTKTSLREGKILVLLDGLDEVPTENFSEVSNKIKIFANQYNKNRYITSCRIAAYRYNFRQFTDISIAEFNDTQIQNFIVNWFNEYPKQGENCWEQLQGNEYKAIKELAHTPLILTLICLVYKQGNQLPNKRATLYARALQILLEQWDEEKEVPREQVYKGLDVKGKELMLSEIAHNTFIKNQIFIEQQVIAQQIEIILGDLLPNETMINGKKVLRSIEAQHGVLVERADSVYSFSHLTIQEFLTAHHIMNMDDAPNYLKTLVVEHIVDDRWREVFLMLAGLRPANKLLRLIEQVAQCYINTSKLRQLMDWADQVSAGSEGAHKPAAKRAFSIYFALDLAHDRGRLLDQLLEREQILDQNITRDRDRNRKLARALTREPILEEALQLALQLVLDLDLSLSHTLGLDLACARSLSCARNLGLNRARDLALSRAREIQKESIIKPNFISALISTLEVLKADSPDDWQPLQVRQAFIERIDKIFLETLQLNPEQLTLSVKEVEALTNYLHAQELMIKCKDSAIRVSRTTWEEIEGRMLLFHGSTAGS